MGKVDLVQFQSEETLAQAAAIEWLNCLPAVGPHFAAFSGGRIAEKFFDAIASQARECTSSLAHVDFFWADERCVPPDNPESNYALMRSRLLEPLKVPQARVHRIKGELGPELATQEASDEFARVVRPVLDFVFLGMGEDGHIASIFPSDPLNESPREYYRPLLSAPKPPPQRVTMAMHAMVAARNVWVLAVGSGKEEALGKSLAKRPGTPLGSLLQRREFTRVFTNLSPEVSKDQGLPTGG
jgi:6-phosphogluconolactonase